MDSDEDYYVEYSEEDDFNSSAGGDDTEKSSDEKEAEDDFNSGAGSDDTDKSSEEKDLPYGAASGPRKNYRILNKDDLKRLRENDISTVTEALCVSRGTACALLCRNKWNLSTAYDCWLAASDNKTPESSTVPAERASGTEVCTICLEEIAAEQMVSAACGHPFCGNCWRSYINISINDGPGCLTLSCPEPKCKTFVGPDMIDSLSSDEDWKKYNQFLHRFYVESHPAIKWCPGPGCDFAVEFTGGETYDVTCDCSFKFCWNCTEEKHRPVDCKTVARWAKKNRSDGENTNWIIANTKLCPKCHRSIQKNQGCNHMICQQPCGFEFCWICLGPWYKHQGFYICNKFKETKETLENEKTRKMARKLLARYTHCYERFDSNDKALKRALLDSVLVRNEHIATLGRNYNETHGQLQFVVEAWDQIVECRRVLKWTYAYGYYLPDKESRKKRLFEYLQGQAETTLERLHYCAEMKMDVYLKGEYSVQDFRNFRSRLAGLTSVTKTYFKNLVTALENNLSEAQTKKI